MTLWETINFLTFLTSFDKNSSFFSGSPTRDLQEDAICGIWTVSVERLVEFC